MNLDETQALFYRLLTRTAPVDSEELEACFLPSAAMSVEERTDIYTNMYVWRQVDALREDFPKLAHLLGDGAFYSVCEAYIAAYPSEHPDLGRLGRKVPAFLKGRSGPDERSDLADLAALEWARAEVFFGAPATAVDRETIASFGENLVAARLQLIPALRLLSLDHDVVSLWRHLDDVDEEPAPEVPASVRAPTAVVVWRPEHEVFHTTLEADEARALGYARTGAKVAEVCAAFDARTDPAQAAFAALASWLDEGWIAAIKL